MDLLYLRINIHILYRFSLHIGAHIHGSSKIKYLHDGYVYHPRILRYKMGPTFSLYSPRSSLIITHQTTETMARVGREKGTLKIQRIMDNTKRKQMLRTKLPILVKKTRELAVLCGSCNTGGREFGASPTPSVLLDTSGRSTAISAVGKTRASWVTTLPWLVPSLGGVPRYLYLLFSIFRSHVSHIMSREVIL